MWLRFDKKLGCFAKNKLIKKLLSGYVVFLIMLMSFSLIFVVLVGAKENLPIISDGDGNIKLPVDTGHVDTDPVNIDPVDTDPVDTDPVDTDPVDTDPVDTDPVDIDPVDIDPVDIDPVDTDPVDIDPVVKAENAENGNIKIKIETVLGNVSKDKKTEIISENYIETDVYSVSFTPSIDLKKAKLTVAKLKEKPEEIIEIPIKNKSVYAYLDIKLTADGVYIEEDGIESMKFIFEVKWSWINENNIDKETILLVRYHDTEWQNLTTTCLGENDTYVYYEAETPGLSTFAVVGSELVESSASYVEEVPEMLWILNMGIIASSSTMLFVVIFKARYIYLDEEDDIKNSKKRLFDRKL